MDVVLRDVSCGFAIGDPGSAATAVGSGPPTDHPAWPDTAIDAVAFRGLEVRSASVRGVAHRQLGTPRQDACSMVRCDGDALLITVCDGLGSYASSHLAADLVARELGTALRRDPETSLLQWDSAFAMVSAAMRELGGDTSLATTALAACVRPSGDGFLAELAWVGDSGAYLLHPSAQWELVAGSVKTAADAGPLSSATRALPTEVPTARFATVEFDCDTALFLATDGVADPLGTGAGEVGATLAEWWALPPDKLTFAAQVGFARRGFDDDRTVVGVWPS